MITFSIVITTYNRLDFLKIAIQSALNQSTYCEIIIVDDGSCDGTKDYVKTLGNRIKYYRNSINLGHSVSVNKGVQKARGEWVKLLDDDDCLLPNCIETMQKNLIKFPHAVLCSCQVKKMRIITNIFNGQVAINDSVLCIKQQDIHYGMLLDICPLGTPVQVAFQKEAFLKSGGWNQEFDGNYDDINSWIEIAKYGDALFINQVD